MYLFNSSVGSRGAECPVDILSPTNDWQEVVPVSGYVEKRTGVRVPILQVSEVLPE